MPVSPSTYSAASMNCLFPGFASTQKGVAEGTILPWSKRATMLAKIIAHSPASVVMCQELGHDEAYDLAGILGERWRYQRNGLSAVLWRDDWTLTEEPGREPVSRDWQLPPYKQNPEGRTLIAVRLRHNDTGQYFFAASAHLASNSGWGVSALTAATARARQAQFIADKLHKYSAVMLAADLNSRGTLPGTPRAVLSKDGWTFLEPVSLVNDPHRGIDGVAAKRRVILQRVTVLPLGAASDHSGRLIQFTIINKADPA